MFSPVSNCKTQTTRAHGYTPVMFRRSFFLIGIVWVVVATAPLEAGAPDRLQFEAVQLLRQGQYGQAEPLLENLLTTRPSATNTYLLGLCRLKRWKLDSAAELLHVATTAEPGRHAWLNTFAECQLERGRCDLAIELLDRAIAKADQTTYRYNRAMCLLNLGRIEQAEEDLQVIVKETPNHAPATVRLAEILVSSGRMSEAGSLLDTLSPAGTNQEALFLMARVHIDGGNIAQAESDFRAVLERTPGHTGALYGLGRLLMADKRTTEGQAILDRFKTAQGLQEDIENLRDHLANHPRETEVRLRLAGALRDIGNSRECLLELENARRSAPDEPRVYRQMAEVFRHLGQTAEACRAEDLALELETATP